MLTLRKKFFFSDQNVDRNDPVQLNLLYVQVARDSLMIHFNNYLTQLFFTILFFLFSFFSPSTFLPSHYLFSLSLSYSLLSTPVFFSPLRSLLSSFTLLFSFLLLLSLFLPFSYLPNISLYFSFLSLIISVYLLSFFSLLSFVLRRASSHGPHLSHILLPLVKRRHCGWHSPMHT